MRISVGGLVVAAAVVLIGCGAGAGPAPSATPRSASSTAAPSSVAPPSVAPSSAVPPSAVVPSSAPRPSAAAPAPPRPTPSATPTPAQPVTVLGVVHAGARPGCDSLVAADGRHYLLLDVTDPPLGVPVEVTGTPDATLVSYCNAGLPLHVQRISRR